MKLNWYNTNFTAFDARNNPNLTCIQVDDATWSTINWTNIDDTASFSEDCSVLAINENSIASFIVYPNPATDYIHIENTNTVISKITFTNLLGQTVLVKDNETQIDIATLVNGVYIMTIEDDKGNKSTFKIIKK